MIKRLGLLAFTTLALAFVIEVGGHSLAPGQFGMVTPAEAIIGMPLTPVSVAGVARRTTRRCMAGVYYC